MTTKTPRTDAAHGKEMREERRKLETELAAMTAERDRLIELRKQDNRDYGCELRDPNGTIWEHANEVTAERDKWRGIADNLDSALHAELLGGIMFPEQVESAILAYREASK